MGERKTHGTVVVADEDIGDDQAMEGARAGGESGGGHVVNDLGNPVDVAVASALHQLFHEDQPQPFLGARHGSHHRGRRVAVVILAGLLSPPAPAPAGPPRRRRHRRQCEHRRRISWARK